VQGRGRSEAQSVLLPTPVDNHMRQGRNFSTCNTSSQRRPHVRLPGHVPMHTLTRRRPSTSPWLLAPQGYDGRWIAEYVNATVPEMAFGEYWDTCSYTGGWVAEWLGWAVSRAGGPHTSTHHAHPSNSQPPSVCRSIHRPLCYHNL
jgi:hypothetical protein